MQPLRSHTTGLLFVDGCSERISQDLTTRSMREAYRSVYVPIYANVLPAGLKSPT